MEWNEMSAPQQAIKFDIHSFAKLNFIFQFRHSNACDFYSVGFGNIIYFFSSSHSMAKQCLNIVSARFVA